MRVNVAVPEEHVSAPILNASLEAVTRLNQAMLKERSIPTFRRAVNQVRWRPEPPGDEHFDHAKTVLSRGWGDCDDLAPWHASSLRHTGEDPGARAIVKRSGPKRWHAVVQRSDGSIDDPSREAGMRAPSSVAGAVLPVLGCANVGAHIALPRLAVRPIISPVEDRIEAWQARADLPWHWRPGDSPIDVAMASLHRSPTAAQAICGALDGAIQIGMFSGRVQGDTLDVADAMASICGGMPYDDVRRAYGDETAELALMQVNGFFQKIGNGLKKIGKGIVKAVVSKAGRALISIVPGVGPAVAASLDVASGPLLKAMDREPKKGKKAKLRKVQFGKNFHAKKAVLKVKTPAGAPAPAGAKLVKQVKPRAALEARKVRKAICYFPSE